MYTLSFGINYYIQKKTIRRGYITEDECPAYGASSEGTAGDDTWSGTDDNDAYEKMVKHSHKHSYNVPAAESCMLIVATYCDCAVAK